MGISRYIGKLITSPKVKYSRLMFALRNMFLLSDYDKILVDAITFTGSNGINGDYYEFGLGEGFSFILANKTTKQLSGKFKNLKNTRFIGFDSFEGLPEIENIDKHITWKKGKYRYSSKKFIDSLQKNKIDTKKVMIIKGLYKDSLKKEAYDILKYLNYKKASIIFIDCDLYKSAKQVMKFINNLIQEGTVIILDDWAMYKLRKDRGIQKAYYEWKKTNNYDIVPLCNSYNRVAFIIRKIYKKRKR